MNSPQLTALFFMAMSFLFIISSYDLHAQASQQEFLAIDYIEPNEPEKSEAYKEFYFADIMEARRKLTEVRTRVEHNYKNNILSDKKYKKQLFSLNNSLEYLDVIEERRKKYLKKKNK